MAKMIHTVVFKAGEGGGNPCPITLEADDLSFEEMQALTAQYGEEAAFICRAKREDCDWRPYYFVPTHPMEMCVHATLGTATVLVEEGYAKRSPLFFETAFGPVRVEWERAADGRIDVSVEQFLPKTLDKAPTRTEVAAALRIPEEELGDEPLESVATSRFKLIVPLKRRAVLDALEPDFEKLWELCDRYKTTGFYPYAPERLADGQLSFCARQFPNRSGYPEDPATGVAASALGAYLTLHKAVPIREEWNRFLVRQGEAMGRPSLIVSEICVENGQITRTRVCGRAEIDG